MTLLTPMMGLIAALIVVPLLVALYMLKLRRTRRDISSTLLWKSQTEDVRANALMQRLRLSPLFLLQCLLLLLLALALMQPVLNGWTRPSGRVVLLIDQSASMQTLDAPAQQRAWMRQNGWLSRKLNRGRAVASSRQVRQKLW